MFIQFLYGLSNELYNERVELVIWYWGNLNFLELIIKAVTLELQHLSGSSELMSDLWEYLREVSK